MRRTKIVCTLGPATSSRPAIDRLIAAGMDCARLNFSHGTHQEHAAVATDVRAAARAAKRPIAILADLCGPKIRVGHFPAGEVVIKAGNRFTLTGHEVEGTSSRCTITYDNLAKDIKRGDSILLDDGLLQLTVEEIEGDDVHCRVISGGVLRDRKGVNLPGANLSIPALTDQDRRDLKFAVGTLDVDLVALSFVRHPDDVRQTKALAGRAAVIAKIEKPEAITHLREIVKVADGCMVARGDLGVELGTEKVPLLQKRVIREANHAGKLVITATQMLESMTHHPRPTRAETNDVANAVLDGTDAVMLSGETAVGRYPVQTVETMGKIIREVEQAWLADTDAGYHREMEVVGSAQWSFLNAAAHAATLFAKVLPLGAVVCFTRDGRAPRLISEYRSRAPIIAVTKDEWLANQLAVEWGVYPTVSETPRTQEQALEIGRRLVASSGLCKKGDVFAMVTRVPAKGRTNSVQLHRL